MGKNKPNTSSKNLKVQEKARDISSVPQAVTHSQVYMYVPNLIGYFRFIFLAISPYFALDKQRWAGFFWFYLLSYGLDFFDGKAARAFD